MQSGTSRIGECPYRKEQRIEDIAQVRQGRTDKRSPRPDSSSAPLSGSLRLSLSLYISPYPFLYVSLCLSATLDGVRCSQTRTSTAHLLTRVYIDALSLALSFQVMLWNEKFTISIIIGEKNYD